MSTLQVFVYEFVTAGGWYHVESGPPRGSLLTEATAMLGAVARDFADLDDVKVRTMWDARLAPLACEGLEISQVYSADEETDRFRRFATECDRTLVIAPEFDGWLVSKTRTAHQQGAVLISPGVDFIQIAADKCLTAEWLRRAGVPTPRTVRYCHGDSLPQHIGESVVIKPIDGAGSTDVRRMAARDVRDQTMVGRQYCLQEFCVGRPASIATICGPEDRVVLPGCWQAIQPATFAYQGGSTIEDSSVRQRLNRLATATLDALPPTNGYVGIDLIVGDADDGSLDRVLEVNPRLTTSYVGLRALTQGNLTDAIMSAFDCRPVRLSFGDDPVEFLASGEVSTRKRGREGQALR